LEKEEKINNILLTGTNLGPGDACGTGQFGVHSRGNIQENAVKKYKSTNRINGSSIVTIYI